MGKMRSTHAGSSSSSWTVASRRLPLRGSVANLFLKPGHGSPMITVPQVRAVERHGLEGDVSFGSARRQILLVDTEMLARHRLEPGWIRENVTVTGFRVNDLCPGTRLGVGAAVIEITSDCAPCEYLDSIRPGLRGPMEGQRGVLASVVKSGTIQVGDSLQVLPPPASGSWV